MKIHAFVIAATATAAVASLQAKTVFEENFMNYGDFAPRITRDPGLLIGTDPIWKHIGQLDCNAKNGPADVFVEPIAVPDAGFNMTAVVQIRGKKAKTETNKETGEVKILEPAEASFFDLVFLDKDGKRETLRIASDNFAGTPVEFLDGGRKNFGVKVRGRDVEIWYAPDRGHEFKSVAKASLKRKPAAFNIGCTPGKSFGLNDLRVTTSDEPLMSFPVERHFAAFKSISQPLANATAAKGDESISFDGARRAGVRFSLGATNRAVKVGYVRKDGSTVEWTGRIGDASGDRRDAYLGFARSPLGSQWVRPNTRPFCENAEGGQRGMVPSGFDVLREWNKIPPASKHVFDLDFTRDADGSWVAWIDGSRAAFFKAGDEIESFVFKPGAGVAYAVKDDAKFAAIDRARFEALDFAENPRAKAMAGDTLKGVSPGVAEFGGAPVKIVAPIDSADVAICRQGKGNWALEVEEYLGREPSQGFPMAIHYRVPSATYVKAHIVFALDPDPKKDAILTVRLGRYERNGVGGNRLGDTILDFRGGVPGWCRKIGEVAHGSQTLPLYYAEVPLKVGRIIDFAAREGDWLDFEFMGKGWENFQQIDESMKPDPNSSSAFNIFGATLEKAPFSVFVREAQPGNIFTADEKDKKTAFDIVAARRAATAAVAGRVKWVAKDIDGNEAFKGEKKWRAAAGATNRVEIPFGNVGPGWYSLDVTFADAAGKDLFTHEAALGVMPEAGRVATRRESPYAVWWFNTHGSTGDPAIGGPIMKKAGIRKFSWNSFQRTEKDEKGRNVKVLDQEMYDKYDTAGCGNFHVPGRRGNFDPEKGVFMDKTDPKTGAVTKGEAWFVEQVRGAIAKMPKDTVPTPMIWHESAPRAFVAEELIGLDVPAEPPYPMAEADAKYINECARLLRKHFPDLAPRLQLGNSTWSAGAVIGPMRFGAKAESYGRIGIETPSQTIVPERLQDCNIQGQHATMDMAEAISGKRVKCNGTWEFVYRTERDLGIRTQAEYYVRDILISLAHDYYLISPGIFFDCSTGYYNGLWGGSGLLYRAPWVYPKPAIVAYGVLTKALDGVKMTRQLDTGSTTVYAVEFKRKDGKYATALWASRGDVEFSVSSPSGGKVVQMLGRESPLAKGDSAVKGGSSPCYLITDKPLASVKAGARSYPKSAKILERTKVAAAMDDAAEITLAPDPWLASPFHSFLPYLQPAGEGEISVRTAEDEEKGKCIELALGPAKEKPANKFVDRYVTRYTTMRFKEPKPIEGKPAVIGVWVKGDSNWGQVRFEIEDAGGEVFKNMSTGRWWCCDIMDWPGNLSVNFDGWAYVYCPLRDTDLIIERSPGTVAEQWVSEGGDKKIDFPIKLRAVSVGVNRSKLDLVDFKPAANVLRFKDAGAAE